MTCLGCELVTYAPVTLRDGRTVCTSCPDYRIETEARHVAAMDWKRREDYLAGVAKARGKAAAEALRVASVTK